MTYDRTKNKFILGDCMDPENGLPSYPDKFFDLAIVDPPYGIGEDGRKTYSRGWRTDGTAITRTDKRNGRVDTIRAPVYKLTGKWDNEQPDQRYFDELFRVSKHQIIWGCNYLQFNQKQQSSGRIIWDKVNGGTDQSDCEIAWTSLFSSVRQIEYMWNGMLQGKSLKHGRIQQGDKSKNERRIHPTHKPERLYAWLLHLKQVQKGWHILDTHTGGASSLVACEKYHFPYTAFEIDPDYYAAAQKRMSAGIQKMLF